MFKFKVTCPDETSTILASTEVEARDAAVELTGGEYWSSKVAWIPQVGDGCHYGIGSDRYPFTVVEVSKSGHRVVVENDKARGGLYVVRSGNLDAKVFTRRADGRYRPAGSKCGYLAPGRESYMDPDF